MATSLQDKVNELRQLFLERLPQNLLNARHSVAELARCPTDTRLLEEIFRICHSIKGTGRSFGLAQIGEVAAAAETRLLTLKAMDAVARTALLPDILTAIGQDLDAIESLSQGARISPATEIMVPAKPRLPVEAETRNKAAELGARIEAAGSHAGAGHEQKRIFLCDDDLQADALAAQLAAFGYDVTAFRDPEALRRAVTENPPSAIIMDIVFPGDSSGGTSLVMRIRKDIPDLPPVIFVSARQDFDARFRAVRAGGDAYFTKPIKGSELVDTLDLLTRAHEPEPFRILIVDDEPQIAAYHSFILAQQSMITRLLHEPTAILQELDEFRPDLVLMDMHMPGCSGRDLARVIRQVPEFVGLPIVFLSSETDKQEQASALSVGAEGFLTKPIEPADLIAAVALRAERMRTLRSLMVRDSLTNLFNHTFITQFLSSAIAAAARRKGTLCMVMIDIDFFKSFNDGYGHPAGDQVLVTLARFLQRRLRGTDIVGRYGGEEFGIILTDVSLKDGIDLVEGLRRSFSKIRFHFGKNEAFCTFSAGIAAFPQFSSPEMLIDAADKALYQAKKLGRNRVVGNDPDHPSSSSF